MGNEYVQHIRRSQLVLTYGPGAIIEGRSGPRLIPSFNNGLGNLYSKNTFERYEISDSRARTAIKNIMNNNNVRIFSIPTNPSLGKASTEGIYDTYLFPGWSICYGKNGNHRPILYKGTECPVCKNNENSSPVRFVAACIEGHLDDVDWDFAVHYESGHDNKCRPEYYYWESTGSSLHDIKIRCPRCGRETTMKRIYDIKFPCTGRTPEKEAKRSPLGKSHVFIPMEKRHPKTCKSPMRVILRQSSSLRIPFTLTFLTIPDFDNKISNILQRNKIHDILVTMMNSPSKPDEKIFIEWLRNMKNNGQITSEEFDEIEGYIEKDGYDKFLEKFNRLHSDNRNFMDFIYEEYESLISGPRSTENFKMEPPENYTIKEPELYLKVYPIKILKTVTVQTGYYRMPYTPEDISENNKNYPKINSIGTSFTGEQDIWYPGFEGKGEGIFITFQEGKIPEIKKYPAYAEWLEGEPVKTPDNIWGDVVKNPIFVWLHTLSHAVIMEISLNAGYSSSSIRERIYVSRGKDNGGILIYTYSPGSDGSMGGLSETAYDFGNILERAYERIRYCSNDPLCRDVRRKQNMEIGAACYSCLMISETSCEHRNRWLDRHIILGD
ncbi:MAG: DrmB family protein [Thermoplasmata archaeon]